MPRGSKGPNWSHLKRRLKSWGRPELLGLVQDLFALSAENREFLAARLMREPESKGGGRAAEGAVDAEVLAPFRRRIEGSFYARSGWLAETLDLAGARKAIRDYRKASGDLAGTLELMLHYVESGTDFTLDFGDIDGPFYDSLLSVLLDLAKALRTPEGRPHYPRFRDRLLRLSERACHIGWGYGDELAALVDELEKAMNKPGPPLG